MFQRVATPQVKDPFTLIGKEWLLLSAGKEGDFNTMTASWGTMGVMWNKNIVMVAIRPQRHTYGFFEREEYFTVSVLKEGMQDAYRVCGTKSGKDCDKVSLAGLTPYFEDNLVTFREARVAIVCKKICIQDLDPKGFLDSDIEKHYPIHDYHRFYFGEIVDVLEAK